LKKQCGVLQKKKIKRSPGKLEEQESSVKKRKGRSNTAETKSPTGKRASRIMQEIQSSPAKNPANQKLVDQLAELGDYESKTGHIQRGTSRMRAAKQLKEAKEEIKSGEQARKLDRIGPSAAAKIEEILHHGLKGAIEEYQQEKTEESQHKSPQELASPPPHHTDEEDRPPEEEDVEERSAEEEARREEAMENKHELEDAIADEEEEQQEREEEEANLDV
jgi:hypothetical protein